jgi:hypothetical protein
MKRSVVLFTALLISAAMYAQNDMKARIELEDAETAYNEERFDDALKHLDNTQELLGRWSHQIGYLRILSLDKLCDYMSFKSKEFTNKSKEFTKLQSEVKLYIDYANKNSGSIERDKFREIYAIEKS